MKYKMIELGQLERKVNGVAKTFDVLMKNTTGLHYLRTPGTDITFRYDKNEKPVIKEKVNVFYLK